MKKNCKQKLFWNLKPLLKWSFNFKSKFLWCKKGKFLATLSVDEDFYGFVGSGFPIKVSFLKLWKRIANKNYFGAWDLYSNGPLLLNLNSYDVEKKIPGHFICGWGFSRICRLQFPYQSKLSYLNFRTFFYIIRI